MKKPVTRKFGTGDEAYFVDQMEQPDGCYRQVIRAPWFETIDDHRTYDTPGQGYDAAKVIVEAYPFRRKT